MKPGGQDGGYFETVDLLEAAQTGPTPTLILTTPRGKQTLEHGGAVVIRGSIAGGAVKVDAPLAFVGYGMQDATVVRSDHYPMVKMGVPAVMLATGMADADARPQWYANDYFGDLFAPNGTKAPKPAGP